MHLVAVEVVVEVVVEVAVVEVDFVVMAAGVHTPVEKQRLRRLMQELVVIQRLQFLQ
jgi:hypothetical protein